ncbi:MAG: hypothetical protein PHS93_07815 [Candidatus Omnitrophica bacterium]|nr:hypothetical protein [Candidatus Omnitrophota bacterium]
MKMTICHKSDSDPVICIKTNRPKMSEHRGRTWDYEERDISGYERIKVWFDSTWGLYGYFEICGQWWKTKIDNILK